MTIDDGDARRWRIAALGAILALAFALRWRGLDFGLPALLDPDEPIFALIGLKLLKEGTLNPGWFGHPGTITIYSMALVEAGVFLAGRLTGRFPDAHAFSAALFHDPAIVFLPGRIVMLLSGLVTILLAYRLARRLFGTRIALLTALLLAIDPIHVRYSQIIRTDMQATIFVLLALIAAVRVADRGRWRDYLVAGAWLGIACATKWPSATAAAGVLGAAAWRWRRDPAGRASTLRGLGAFALAAPIACVVASPFLLLDIGTVVSNLHGEARPIHLGATGHGLVGNLWWYAAHPLGTALGAVGLVLTLVGFAAGTRRRPAFGCVVGGATVAFLLSISAQHLVWERWVVPLLPLLTIALAVGSAWLIDRASKAIPALAGPAAIVVAFLIALPPLRAGDAQAAERAVDTRRLATEWARAHVSPGSTVAIEYLAFDALRAPWRFLYPAGDRGCVDVRTNLVRGVTVARVGAWRRSRPIVDFGGIDEGTAPTCRADYLILSNYDRYLAEAARFPDEVANYRRLIARGRLVATFAPRPGQVGGPVVRIYRTAGAAGSP